MQTVAENFVTKDFSILNVWGRSQCCMSNVEQPLPSPLSE